MQRPCGRKEHSTLANLRNQKRKGPKLALETQGLIGQVRKVFYPKNTGKSSEGFNKVVSSGQEEDKSGH